MWQMKDWCSNHSQPHQQVMFIRITSGGNVGINTDNPSDKLPMITQDQIIVFLTRQRRWNIIDNY